MPGLPGETQPILEMARRGRRELDKLGYTYFITTTVVNYERVFSMEESYNYILLESMKYLCREHSSEIIAFVYMPSHIHFIITMNEGESISDYLRDFKKYTSKQIKSRLLASDKKGLYTQLQELGKYKFWMDRFDSQIILTEKILNIKINYIHYNPLKAGLVNEIDEWKFSSAYKYYTDFISFNP